MARKFAASLSMLNHKRRQKKRSSISDASGYDCSQTMDNPMLPEPLRSELDNLIDEFQQPPSVDEAAGGWDPALKARWADWFVKLRGNLEMRQETPAGWGILRAMDFDGVSRTPLASHASSVGRLVDEWKRAG